jgi:acetyl esterase/lipase
MTSLRMRGVAAVLRVTHRPTWSSAERARRRIAAPKGRPDPPARLRSRHAVSSRQVEGCTCWTVAPRGGGVGRAAVYLHGGAYVSEIAPQHWSLVGRLADAGVRLEVPLYGLAPRHTHREALPFMGAVHRQLVDEVGPSAVTLAGDSAGGGLALSLAQALLGAGLPQPRGLVLVAPWLDLTLSHPDLPAVEARDPWLSRVGLLEAGRAWAGGDDPRDPRLSPLAGPLAGLAPIRVWVGTRDIALPDVLLLRERATAVGGRVEVTVCPGAVHVYPLVPAPEGRAAARAIVAEVSG